MSDTEETIDQKIERLRGEWKRACENRQQRWNAYVVAGLHADDLFRDLVKARDERIGLNMPNMEKERI